jgi:hypothetical protein
MWYSSCVEWRRINSRLYHRYHLKYAASGNGTDWQRNGTVALDFRDEYEYAISVPRVINDGACYKMWFSCRAEKHKPTYRIGYAQSRDGVSFYRPEESTAMDVSESGWDSEMICYPFVFDLDNNRYMLYNGNGYGKSGFGLAVLEQD